MQFMDSADQFCRTQSNKVMLPPVITCAQNRLCMFCCSGVVQEVIERHSEMSDPAIANVDQIVLVMSLNLPPFNARQATRFLVSAEAASIPVMLLLNKADLLEDDMTQALVAEVMLTVGATRLHMRSDILAGWLKQNLSSSSHQHWQIPRMSKLRCCC